MSVKDTGKVNIHGKEYETVASRVNRFREEHKQELSITTEIVDRNDAEVVVRAVISAKDGFVIATGYAEEKRAASQINRTSALENAETSAIGRALANFGIGGTEFASADEVANAISQQRSSSTPAPRQSSEPVEDVLARAKTKINETLEEQGYVTVPGKKAFILKVLKKSSIESLDDADAVMDQLENEKGV